MNGVNNPSQQVVWKLTGATSSDTRVTPNGLVFVGKDEQSNMLVLTAYSQKTPEVYGEAIIDVVPADTPGVDEVMLMQLSLLLTWWNLSKAGRLYSKQ